jgi:hypothetical protein
MYFAACHFITHSDFQPIPFITVDPLTVFHGNNVIIIKFGNIPASYFKGPGFGYRSISQISTLFGVFLSFITDFSYTSPIVHFKTEFESHDDKASPCFQSVMNGQSVILHLLREGTYVSDS